MAKRRMFSIDIIDSDAFLDMPLSAQSLYYHLGMRADDDGFISPKKVLRMLGCQDDDLKILLAKRFLLPCDNGVVIIKHWPTNNLIRSDRYTPTKYIEQKSKFGLNRNGDYTESEKAVDQITEVNRPMVNQTATNGRQNRTPGKVRLGKVNKTTNVVSSTDVDHKALFYELVRVLNFSDTTRYTENRKRKLIARLRTYSREVLCTAATNIAADGFMQGDNPGGKRYGTIDYLLRNDEIIDRWLVATKVERVVKI